MRFLISGMTTLAVAVGMTGLAVSAQTQQEQGQQPQTQQQTQQQPQNQQQTQQQPQNQQQTQQQPQTQQQMQQPETQQPQTSSTQMGNAQNQNKSAYPAAEVRQAQEQLKKEGDYTGKVDGIYGPQTRAAVEKYQKSQNLPASGKLDSQTSAKLGIQSQK